MDEASSRLRFRSLGRLQGQDGWHPARPDSFIVGVEPGSLHAAPEIDMRRGAIEACQDTGGGDAGLRWSLFNRNGAVVA